MPDKLNIQPPQSIRQKVGGAIRDADVWLDEQVRYYGGPQAHQAFRNVGEALNFFSPVQDISQALGGSAQAMAPGVGVEGRAAGLADMVTGLAGAFAPGNAEDLAALGIFAGIGARNAPKARIADALAEQDDLLFDAREIWQRHGAARGPDDVARWEIPDEGAFLNSETFEPYRGGYKAGAWLPGDQRRSLREILDHPEFIENYPEIADFDTRIQVEPGITPNGFFDRNQKLVVMQAQDPETLLRGLLHEGQHAVQWQEGMGLGASPEYFAAMKDSLGNKAMFAKMLRDRAIEQGDNAGALKFQQNLLGFERAQRDLGDPIDAYYRTMGEVEARDVMARRWLTPVERQDQAPNLLEHMDAGETLPHFIVKPPPFLITTKGPKADWSKP